MPANFLFRALALCAPAASAEERIWIFRAIIETDVPLDDTFCRFVPSGGEGEGKGEAAEGEAAEGEAAEGEAAEGKGKGEKGVAAPESCGCRGVNGCASALALALLPVGRRRRLPRRR